MNKTEMLSIMKRLDQKECETRGLFPLVQMLIRYFTDPNIPEYEFGGIFDSLPKHVARAVDILRTGDDAKLTELRVAYIKEMGRNEEIPSLTEISFGGVGRNTLCFTLSHDLSRLLLGEDSAWLEEQLLAYFTAQDTVVKQMIHRFDLAVYRQGLCDIINECRNRGINSMSGKFGETSLRSSVVAVSLTFALTRRIEGETVIVFDKGTKITKRLPFQMVGVTFCGDDGKKFEPRFRIKSLYTDVAMAIGMFEDVTTCWPKNRKEQEKVYKPDLCVGNF